MANKQGKGKIDYLHYTWGPVKGRCGKAQKGKPCPYCWMEAMWKRFSHKKDGSILWDQKIRLDKKELKWVPRESGKRIGVCFSTDLFHSIVPDDYVEAVLDHVESNQKDDYLFLTRAVENLGKFDFPQNAWVGTTVDGTIETQANAIILSSVKTNAKYKYLSFEPLILRPLLLLGANVSVIWDRLDWIIIGPDSRKGAKAPDPRWVEMLVDHARLWNVAVWMKDKLVFPGGLLKELPGEHTNERGTNG